MKRVGIVLGSLFAAGAATFGVLQWMDGEAVVVTRSMPRPTAHAVNLDAAYEDCVNESGFDPGGVQVLVWESEYPSPEGALVPEPGTPWWVKTGRDVPADIHRPCLMRLGGADPQSSSHGAATPPPALGR